MKHILLSRDEFREKVFERDNYTCLVCDQPAVDAHHLIERRLFDDGGYYLDNGVSVCAKHHLEAEMTTLDADVLRCAAGITSVVLPEGWRDDVEYTKWGDIMLDDNTRVPGPLFQEESVQKILARGRVLHLYRNIVVPTDLNLMQLVKRARTQGMIAYEGYDNIEIRTTIGSSIILFFTEEGAFEFAERSIDGFGYEPEHMEDLLNYLNDCIVTEEQRV